MVDDRPEDNEPSPDLGRAKRAPPTIDLEASEVSGETRNYRRRCGAHPFVRGAFEGRDFIGDLCGNRQCRHRRAGDRRSLVGGLARGFAHGG